MIKNSISAAAQYNSDPVFSIGQFCEMVCKSWKKKMLSLPEVKAQVKVCFSTEILTVDFDNKEQLLAVVDVALRKCDPLVQEEHFALANKYLDKAVAAVMAKKKRSFGYLAARYFPEMPDAWEKAIDCRDALAAQ